VEEFNGLPWTDAPALLPDAASLYWLSSNDVTFPGSAWSGNTVTGGADEGFGKTGPVSSARFAPVRESERCIVHIAGIVTEGCPAGPSVTMTRDRATRGQRNPVVCQKSSE
jgi:hypothetical protein